VKSVKVKAPCSTSNIGPGFDVFGLALDILHDIVEVRTRGEEGIVLKVEGTEADQIPTEPERNSAGRAAIEFMERYEIPGLTIRLNKGIPPSSGLGSTGTSAAATVLAIDHLLGANLGKRKLVEIGAQGEIVAAGAAHADNVAPAIYGGLVVISSYQPLKITPFPPPRKLVFSIALPRGIEKTTKRARAVLPEKVELSRTVRNIGSASLVIAGLLRSDPKLLGEGMMGDVIVEPNRISLYPGCIEAKQAALDAGAEGATLSGAGPTIIAVVDPQRADPRKVSEAMREAFTDQGIPCKAYVGRASKGPETLG